MFVKSEDTRGSFSIIVQSSPPGGGPPPHRHQNQDEIFRVLEGEFEFFDGASWNPIPKGEDIFALRNSVHTFRNCGTTEGRIQCIVVPGGFEHYLEELSNFSMPQDAERMGEISANHGITFVTADDLKSDAVLSNSS